MPRSILFPLDLSEAQTWEHALPEALGMLDGGTLHVITVIPDFGMSIVGSYFDEGFLDRALDDIGHKLAAWVEAHVPREVEVHPHVVHGRIYEQIIMAADRLGVDTIVLGAPAPAFADNLLGPNAARVVRHAKQSVYVVRG